MNVAKSPQWRRTPASGDRAAARRRRGVAITGAALICAVLHGCGGSGFGLPLGRGDRGPVIALTDLVDRTAADDGLAATESATEPQTSPASDPSTSPTTDTEPALGTSDQSSAASRAVDEVGDEVGDSAGGAPPRNGTGTGGAAPADERPASTSPSSSAPGGVLGNINPDQVTHANRPDSATSGFGAIQRGEWIVDGLVGQINGRPIFAESFLEVLEDRILQIVATRTRPVARDEIILLVNARFDDWVNSELIIAEAESQLSPEAKQGVLAWVRDLQEGEILRRGGTRAGAESSLLEESGMGIAEFLELRRNRALALDLLRRRVSPRAIVSWRDIEREYTRRQAEFNPGATITVGRIWLDTQSDAATIELAASRFANGAGFRAVADELELPNSGAWQEFTLGPEGIQGLELAEVLRNRLVDLPVDRPTDRFEIGRRTVWLGILEYNQPAPRTLYDPQVQITLRNELQARREAIERERFLASLRQRWIAEDIDEMRFRLIDISLRRYWR